jgi:hypothetical protein
MKNTTIPITATIVFSAAVAVLNVVQNEPSRLHANGPKIAGNFAPILCYSKSTTNASGCLAPGWHGKADAYGKKDPANLNVGDEAWECGGKIEDEQLQLVDSGHRDYETKNEPCGVTSLWVVEDDNGTKKWKRTKDDGQLKKSDLCGKYVKIELKEYGCRVPKQ